MSRKVPIVACPISGRDLSSAARGLFSKTASGELRERFSQYLKRKNVFLFNSATSALFVLLKILRKKGGAREVILPAYTSSSLIYAIQKARLKPVLCDVSLDDFDSDPSLLEEQVSGKTLAVLSVNAFGIVGRDLGLIKTRFPDVFFIEDGAQSLGSSVHGEPVGRWSDASFFSFNRGKNLPAYGGGCLVTDRDDLARDLREEEGGLKQQGALAKGLIFLKILGLALAMRPHVYGLIYPLLSLLKEKPAREDFEVAGWTDVQAAVALSLLGRVDDLSRRRYNNGRRLIEGLKALGDAVRLPKLEEGAQAAFNRLPVVFRDPRIREVVSQKLWKAGIETSRMYLRPLHHAFDLGYNREEFPNAVMLAEGLLTLPVHPLVTDRDIDIMLDRMADGVKRPCL